MMGLMILSDRPRICSCKVVVHRRSVDTVLMVHGHGFMHLVLVKGQGWIHHRPVYRQVLLLLLLMYQARVVQPQKLCLRLFPAAGDAARDACTELLGEHELMPDILVVHIELRCQRRQAEGAGRVLRLYMRMVIENLGQEKQSAVRILTMRK